MQIIRDYWRCPSAARGAVVALGNFDGVHLGHVMILKACVDEARVRNVMPAVMTFSPHPREFFAKGSPPLRLQSFRQKMAFFKAAGIGAVFLVRFNARFAGLSPADFVQDVLVRDLQARHVVTGYNFAFGKGRGGDTNFLARAAEVSGIGFSACAPVSAHGAVVSSSAVRALLGQGRVRDVAALLGRHYVIEGRVLHGDKRGRAMGYPTANIALGALFRPAYGVYAVRFIVDGEMFYGVANVGVRPMYPLQEPLLEVHVFEMQRELYGKRVQVELVDYLREERYFDSVDGLMAQIAADSNMARQVLRDFI